ncbi:CaiB/BaiF CoA-transferase family protein [Reyranella sp.]|uniref:CaiB/BaiF CoA transferase family protein n=1 Tax=Reyranella sp. TaxID=1929291 RepID=UPI0027315563|nr:CoA transferase [Reyranella sp.]MDP2378372.1 CoA transferase [Reyranella sp.]
MADASNMGPLAGVVVLDLTSVLMGPYCTQILGDMGADVVKVESPTGDTSRQGGVGKTAGLPGNFLNINRNKRSIVVDLKHRDGREALLRMAAKADVLVHSMRPHTIQSLGLSYPVLREVNPGLIVCGMFGFGSRGRYAEKAAYDDIIQAASGLAMLQEKVVGKPAYIPTVLADKVAGLNGVNAIAMALFHKLKTGAGQEIEVPMFETLSAFVLIEHLMGHVYVPPISPPLYARVVSSFRRPYKTATGHLGVLVYNNKQWEKFLTLIGRSDLIETEMFATMASRLKYIDKVYGFVEVTLQTRPAEEWLPLLEEAEIPVMPVLSTEDLFSDAHLADVGFFRRFQHETEGELRYPDVTTRFSETPGSVRRMGPRLGENTEEVLRQFGFAETEIANLIAAKAVTQNKVAHS